MINTSIFCPEWVKHVVDYSAGAYTCQSANRLLGVRLVWYVNPTDQINAGFIGSGGYICITCIQIMYLLYKHESCFSCMTFQSSTSVYCGCQQYIACDIMAHASF